MKLKKFNELDQHDHLTEIPTGLIELEFYDAKTNKCVHSMDVPNRITPDDFDHYKSVASKASGISEDDIYVKVKTIHQKNENVNDADIVGITTDKGRKLHVNPNRRNQYFYDYYTGSRIAGKSKYELSKQVFDMAQRNDEIGILAQFCLQIERDSMAHDYDIESRFKD